MRSILSTLAALVLATASQAATVTFSLFIDELGPNTFNLYASSSIGDNAGIALYGAPLLGDITSLDHNSPVANALLSSAPFFSPLGFSQFRSADGVTNISGAQDSFNATSILTYGIGQIAGNLGSTPGVSSLVPAIEQPIYGSPVLLASGTYGAIAPSFDLNSADLLATVFPTVGSRQVIAADIVTTVVPEASTVIMSGIALLGGVFAVARRKSA